MGKKKSWLKVAAIVLLVIGGMTPQVSAELADFEIFIEVNDTAGDAGIQIFLDGDGWDRLKMWDPDRNMILNIRGHGSVGLQGLTEAFFESAEPSFDEQPLDVFLALFPEGVYQVTARSTEGGWDRITAELTHSIPDPPVLVLPIEGDDEVDPDDTVIEWMLVPDPPGSSIVSYEVIVEIDEDDAPFRDFKVLVGPETTSVTVPPEFMEPGTAYKFEVLVKEESGNQTISEGEFETEE